MTTVTMFMMMMFLGLPCLYKWW